MLLLHNQQQQIRQIREEIQNVVISQQMLAVLTFHDEHTKQHFVMLISRVSMPLVCAINQQIVPRVEV